MASRGGGGGDRSGLKMVMMVMVSEIMVMVTPVLRLVVMTAA